MDKIFRFVFFLAISMILFVGCSSKTETGNATPSATGDVGYQIKVILKDKQVASLGLTELHSLPEVTLSISGSTEQGPTLLSVLELAGIKDFSKVKVSGMLKGRVATGELTLNESDITSEVILDFNNQGKTKLCGTKIPDSNWIIDVTEIRVE